MQGSARNHMPPLCWHLLACLFCCVVPKIALADLADSLRTALTRLPQDTTRVQVLRRLCAMTQATDPDAALQYGKEGIALARVLHYDKGLAACYLNVGAAYAGRRQWSEALAYNDSALSPARRVADPSRLALIFINIADARMQLRMHARALSACDSALRYATQSGNTDRKARVYQTLGSVYYLQEKYLEARPYYERAFAAYQEAGDLRMGAIALGNLANVNKRLRNRAEALALYGRAIALADSLGDQNNLAMHLGNLADAYLEFKEPAQAARFATASLSTATAAANSILVANAQLLLAQSWLSQAQPVPALSHARQAYAIAATAADTAMLQTAADLMAESLVGLGRHQEAVAFLRLGRALSDTLARRAYNEEVANLQTQFKVEDQESRIALMHKDAALRQDQIRQQRILIWGGFLTATLALVSLGLLLNRNRLRHRVRELSIRNTIAADLHDEVGSALSSIHILSAMASTQEAATQSGAALRRIKTTAYETLDRLSDIVWAVNAGHEKMSCVLDRIREFAVSILEPVEIYFQMVVGEGVSDLKLSLHQRKQVYLLCKELINNAAKHSRCNAVSLQLSTQGNECRIAISDDGQGFDAAAVSAGNGLRNIEERTESLHGRLKLSTKAGAGVSVQITFPLRGRQKSS